MANRKTIRIVKFKGGCEVNLGHKLNKDGYWRKSVNNGSHIMMHRYFWERKHGKIPEGYTIHHTCGNRACQNIDHMELIDASIHASLTNKERYAERNQEAKEYWLKTGCTGTKLGEVFDVTTSMGCRWIRTWKEET